jgi:hypothetical protein
MAAFDPGYAGSPELFGERSLKFDRFPAPHGIQVGDEFWKQAYSEPSHRAGSLVTRHMLIEAQVRIARGLTDIRAVGLGPSRIMQQDHVDRMPRTRRPMGGGLQTERSPQGPGVPVRPHP